MTHRTRRTVSSASQRPGQAAYVAPWLTLSLLAAAVGSAYAQSAPAPAEAASAPQAATDKKADQQAESQQVTVSATRRRELIRDVPVAISSIEAERLVEVGAKSLNDYLATQPGVVLQNSSVLDGTGYVVIRGLTAGADSNSPTTIYFNEVPLAAGTTFDMNLMDLRSFEVLRGPQGTLYGSSAMGGVVKYIANDPDTNQFSGSALLGTSYTDGGGFNYQATGTLNIPLKENVAALRLSAFGSSDAGWVDATGPAGKEGINSRDSHGGRASLLITPNRQLSINLTALTQTRNSDGNSRIVYSPTTKAPVAGDRVYTDLSVAEPRTGDRQLYSATIEYDFDWAKFSSITAYQKAKDTSTADFTPLGKLFGVDIAWDEFQAKNTKTTQEFRLVSQKAGTFQWLVGAFFDKFELSQSDVVKFTAGGVPGLIQDNNGTRDYRENAVYGNVTWNVTPALALTGGLRYAKYDQTDVANQLGLPTQTISFSESATTYLLTANYRLTPQSNVYARAANGYRPGGANFQSVDPTTGQTIPGAQASYGTDNAWSYEAGYKANFPDQRASMSLAAFDTEWSDMQLFVPGTNTIPGFTANVGTARIYGLEAAGSISPLAGLTLGGSLSLLNPKMTADAPGIGAVSGDQLPNAPKVAGVINARYAFQASGLPSHVGFNWAYMGERNTGFPGTPNPPNWVLPAYNQLDLFGGVIIDRVNVGLYVRNATNSAGQLGASTGEALSTGRIYVKTIEPRTFGITLSSAF